MKDKNNKNAIEIYNLIAENYAKKFDPIESDDDLIFPNTFLGHLKPGMSVVDIGCGTGFSAGYFHKHGMEVVGVDLSSSMIKIARRNYPDIELHEADMREFAPSKLVDAVWAGYSMFHFEHESFESTLEKIKTYLKPGGIFGLVMQLGSGEVEADEPFLPGENKKIYIHLYISDELKDILNKHGFEIIQEKIKKAVIGYEFSFDKILLVAKNN